MQNISVYIREDWEDPCERECSRKPSYFLKSVFPQEILKQSEFTDIIISWKLIMWLFVLKIYWLSMLWNWNNSVLVISTVLIRSLTKCNCWLTQIHAELICPQAVTTWSNNKCLYFCKYSWQIPLLDMICWVIYTPENIINHITEF